MSDLDSYLSTAHGICINNEIIAHLLWADDLILFSDTFQGLQNQLDGLKEYCSNIDEVTDYKHLGISLARQGLLTKILWKLPINS